MRTPHTVFQDRTQLKKLRTGIALFIALAMVSISVLPTGVSARSASIESTVVLQTATAPMLTGTFQVMNGEQGDQFDPHIDCNRATYTQDDFLGALTVRYFDFATNTDHAIPGGSGAESLPDVFGSTVAFTKATISGPEVVLFDTTTQNRTVLPGSKNSQPELGGDLVVFETRSFWSGPNESELVVYDRSDNEVTRLTSDLLFDRNPDVSPNGNVIVWEKCFTSGVGCDIYSATQNGPGDFTTSLLTGAPGDDRRPATNGEIVVYLSDQSGENDIYFQPVTGGSQVHLSIAGDQRDVSIAGNLLLFESEMPFGNATEYDLFVYDINRANLYRVTNTGGNEVLSNITMCNDVARIVYAAPGVEDYDVFAFTFQPPNSAEDQIDDLIELVDSFGLPRGPENSLTTKLQAALAALEASDNVTACSCLTAFINECRAQSGKKLTADQATQLITAAQEIKSALGCQ